MRKNEVQDLAVMGGIPLFDRILHVGRPNLGNKESFFKKAENIFDRVWLTNKGPYVQEFEREIAALTGTKHCIATCNGTVALEIAIRALELREEVIVPSFTFIATAHALQWQAITPVFADIMERTHTLDPESVEQMITPRTTGIIGVHLWGNPCDIEGLAYIAEKYGLKLMFDASHALGNRYHENMIGSFGKAEVFSFHATKMINSFEGGAVVTNDDELAEKIRLMKNFGFSGMDNVIYIGTNGKLNEMAAAMGLTSLESIASFKARNKKNYMLYKSLLNQVPGIQLLNADYDDGGNHQYVVVMVDEQYGLSRDQLMHLMQAENIRVRRYFWPGCHCMEPYRSYYPHAGLLLPVTKKVAQHVLVFPTGMDVDEPDIIRICELIKFVQQHVSEITFK
jgi:dTDP-4-amino-4,6-dideoxygalactose transaminase